VISREQLAWAEGQPAGPGGLASTLLTAGLVTEAQLVATAADRLGLEFVDLDSVKPDPRLARRLPEATARQVRAAPVSEDEEGLVIATADPTDGEMVSWLATHVGVSVRAVAAVPGAVDRYLDRLYARPLDTHRPAATPLDRLLAAVIDQGGSDLHVSVGKPPGIRVDGHIWPMQGQPELTPEVARDLVLSGLTDDQRRRFEEDLELDCSYTAEGVGRFRLNAFVQRGNLGAVLRAIPLHVPEFSELGLPAAIADLATLPRGLVLVTGPTGSGKSTTLASLVDIVNRTRRAHIMTVEDPIEFLHQHKQCTVNQREVGQDTHSFAAALKHVLRQDPDVILVGEMRDLETIATALTAAETGHLVFGTLHTQSAPQSIDRIIDVFPAHQQQQIRTQLSATLRGVVTQQLVPRVGGGRAVAAEVLIASNAVRTLIRDGKTHQIASTMQSGAKQGMQTMDSCLAQLVRDGRVSYEVAAEHCQDEEDLRRLVGPHAVSEPPIAAAGAR